jgi:hypothetical protein
LHVRAPKPDFEVRGSPSALNGPPGAHVPVTFHVLRKEGFEGEIEIEALQAGYSICGGIIPADCETITATVAFPEAPSGLPERLDFRAVAKPGPEQKIIRPVIPTDDTLQAFIYRHLVPSDEFIAFAPGRSRRSRLAAPAAT